MITWLLIAHVCLPFVVGQSSTAMPPSTTNNASDTTVTSSSRPSITFMDVPGWETRIDDYTSFLSAGMKPAAASYVVQQKYATDFNGDSQERANYYYLAEQLGSRLPPDAHFDVDEARVLTLQGYFVDLLPESRRAYESSFMSVWYSFQGATPDPTVSASLHSRADALSQSKASRTQGPVQTSPSAGSAAAGSHATTFGILAALLTSIVAAF